MGESDQPTVKASHIDALRKWSEAGKNLFGLLRDATLFALLILLVGCPALINDRLQRTGLSSVEGPGFKWEREVTRANRQSLAAVTQVEQAKQAANETLAQVDRIARTNPEAARQVAPIRTSLAQTTRRLDRTQNQLASAVIRQQDLLDQASAAPTWVEGYVLSGELTSQGPIERGTMIEIAAPQVNVFEAPIAGSRVVAVLRQGTRVRVVRVTGTRRDGNLQLWVHVERP
jgi:hypothetical protein